MKRCAIPLLSGLFLIASIGLSACTSQNESNATSDNQAQTAGSTERGNNANDRNNKTSDPNAPVGGPDSSDLGATRGS